MIITRKEQKSLHIPPGVQLLADFEKTFINPARQNQFVQENILNNAPVLWIAFAIKTNSAVTGSYTESHIGINTSTSDKLKDWEEVSQS